MRQEQIKFLGKQKPSEFTYEDKKQLNFFSYFIIPLPHKVYDFKKVDEFLKLIKETEWEIVNKNKNRIFDGNNELKKYIYDGFLPYFDETKKKEFFLEKNHFLLNKKIEKSFKVFDKDKQEVGEIIFKEVELWILADNIAFFVIKCGIDNSSNLTLNELSKINRILRDFRNLQIEETEKIIKQNNKSQNGNLIEWIKNLTKKTKDDKSFLNIDNFESEDLYPVFNSSYYAKLLTAIHIEIDENKLDKIEPIINQELREEEFFGASIIEEVSYLLATTSDLYPSKAFESDESYINSILDNGGINIWKYWSGVAIKDSLAFFSLNEGGGMIVSSSKEINYFIYILNLYLNYSVKLLEYNLAQDKYFLDLENSFLMLKNIQKLKNLYMSEEISIKFQPNHIYTAILNGLSTKRLLEEVEQNIEKTHERTKDSTSIIISAVTFIIAIMGFFISQDTIKEFLTKHPFKEYIISYVITITLFIAIMILIISYRKKILGCMSNLKKCIPSFARKIKNIFTRKD